MSEKQTMEITMEITLDKESKDLLRSIERELKKLNGTQQVVIKPAIEADALARYVASPAGKALLSQIDFLPKM